MISRIKQALAIILVSSSLPAVANPFAELPFSPDFRNKERIIVDPDRVKPNPWAYLGFPREAWDVKSGLPSELCIRYVPPKRPLVLINYGMPNISPYRKELISRLALNWRTTQSDVLPTILITLDQEGRLVRAALFESSDNTKLDNAAIYAATVTKYPPLPDWYKGNELTFKINMATIQSLQSQ